VRSFLVATVFAGVSISTASAQQQGNFFSNIGAAITPAVAARRDFERSVADYRNCLVANQNNTKACEGLRHIIDAGHFNGPR
jgi:hypothetical protein